MNKKIYFSEEGVTPNWKWYNIEVILSFNNVNRFWKNLFNSIQKYNYFQKINTIIIQNVYILLIKNNINLNKIAVFSKERKK